MPKKLLLLFLTQCLVYSCEKNVELEIPREENVLVVEGRIETDQPPYVILTRSTGYFEPADLNTFLNTFVHDAAVTVTTDSGVFILEELCLNDIPKEIKPLASAFLGLSADEVAGNSYCLYTVPVAQLLSGNFLKGVAGKTYKLTVETDNQTYFSSVKIPERVALDSAWFRTEGEDSLFGFAWAHLTDPDTLGNAYRWLAKRISHGSYGEMKDNTFIPPFNSVFDDRFINGKSFEFAYDRGNKPSEEGVEMPDEKQHFFKVNDTIVVKFCTIEKMVFEFIRKYETEIWNNGNPFAAPATLPANISGGAIGLWAGYGVTYDTIIAKK